MVADDIFRFSLINPIASIICFTLSQHTSATYTLAGASFGFSALNRYANAPFRHRIEILTTSIKITSISIRLRTIPIEITLIPIRFWKISLASVKLPCAFCRFISNKVSYRDANPQNPNFHKNDARLGVRRLSSTARQNNFVLWRIRLPKASTVYQFLARDMFRQL